MKQVLDGFEMVQAIFGRGELGHLQHPLKRIGQVVHQDIEILHDDRCRKTSPTLNPQPMNLQRIDGPG